MAVVFTNRCVVGLLVSWCFEPSQPQRITSRLTDVWTLCLQAHSLDTACVDFSLSSPADRPVNTRLYKAVGHTDRNVH